MATSTIRKAIGAVKDQTSISLAKVTGTAAPDLEVLVVKATSHDNEPADDKYAREILNMISQSSGYLSASVFAVSKRLSRTHDWIVALKALMLVHKLLNDGVPTFAQALMLSSRRGARILNMCHFRDDTHSNSWDQSGFVKAYALYLDQKLELIVYERKLSVGDDEKRRYEEGYWETREPGYGIDRRARSSGGLNESRRDRNGPTLIRELGPEKVLERLNQLLKLLDCLLASRPRGSANNTRMVLMAVHMLVKDSLRLHADISDVLKCLLDCFLELEYAYCIMAFDAYLDAAKKIDDLCVFYSWWKDTGAMRSFEIPEVQRISEKLLGDLEALLREKRNMPKSSKDWTRTFSETKEEKEQNMNEIKALPPPENTNPSTIPRPAQKPQNQLVTEDLVNLKDDAMSADQQGNKLALALALFSAPGSVNRGEEWIEFSTNGGPEVTSAWENPAVDSGKENWELVLVESASNLYKQKADLAGGFDSLLLNGMYDQGSMSKHVNNSHLTNGSASSVTLRGPTKTTNQILALPAPDGTVQRVGQQDPFAASLCVPPPAYVQIADMERKQQLLSQEQQLWQQYASNGMLGQQSMAKIVGSPSYYDPGLPQGGPQLTGFGQPGGYYYV